MTPEAIASLLVQLGCPADKSLEMARQLDRRAQQLSEAKGRPYEEALTHLLKLMAGGWAAQASGISLPPTPTPAVEASADLPVAAATPAPSPLVEPWRTVSSRQIADHRIFRIRSDRKVHPRTGTEHDLLAIECVNWVVVLAITTSGDVVMIHQFRHGTNTIELELPGGMMDPGETDPVSAGLRELREETGYSGGTARLLGQVFPNPAIQTNICYTVLVEGCERVHEQELDAVEDVAVELIPVPEIPELLASGRLQHALVIVAFAYFLNQRRPQGE